MRNLAVIGTAGRDRSPLLSVALWEAMKVDLRARIEPADALISGGAAWADHLAVHAYLSGWCSASFAAAGSFAGQPLPGLFQKRGFGCALLPLTV